MQSERKIHADINQARDGWIQVTLSGDGAADLTEAQIEAALSAAEPKPMPSVAVENLITQVHDAIDEYREGMKGDKFGPHEWPTVDGIKTTVAQSLRRSALSAQVQDVAGWQPIETAPKDKTPIIIAVPTKDRDDWIVGEGYFDPDHYEGGDWWWANLGYGDYHAGPISECNHWPPELWQPLPVPAAAPAKQES